MDNQAFEILLENLREIKTGQTAINDKLDCHVQKVALIEDKINSSILIPKMLGKIIAGAVGIIASLVAFLRN